LVLNDSAQALSNRVVVLADVDYSFGRGVEYGGEVLPLTLP
jgi:hypothetical protein